MLVFSKRIGILPCSYDAQHANAHLIKQVGITDSPFHGGYLTAGSVETYLCMFGYMFCHMLLWGTS